MFIDASVIVAILGREPGYEELEKRLASSEGLLFVSPLVRFEASVALARKTTNTKPCPKTLHQARDAVDALIEDIDAEEIAVSATVGQAALDASANFGKLSAIPPTSISATALPMPAPGFSPCLSSIKAMSSLKPISLDRRGRHAANDLEAGTDAQNLKLCLLTATPAGAILFETRK